MYSSTRKQLKSCGVIAWRVCQQESSLKVVVSTHHEFVNKKTVLKVVMSLHHVFISAVLKLWYQCFMCLSTRKQFKSCGANASCFYQQESSLKVVVSMHHVFVNKKAVKKLWCHSMTCLSTRKQFKSCGLNASWVCQQENSFKSCDVTASCVY